MNDTQDSSDIWKRWLTHGRNPTDELKRATDEGLKPIRDMVLNNAHIEEGEVILDVGAGTGLISFGALEQVGSTGKVIFSDISQDCLDHCRALVSDLGLLDCCDFIAASIEDLSPIADASVDVITCRSVLIY